MLTRAAANDHVPGRLDTGYDAAATGTTPLGVSILSVHTALSLQELGTRAVVAEALASEAENVERAVKLLCQSAGNGDLQAAKALIPWLNQALGTPTERVEHRAPTSLEDIESMSTEELERIVAEGRARRLQRLESERLGEGDEGGVVAG